MANETFPGVGHRYRADYGAVVFHVDFAPDGKTLRWADASAEDFDVVARMETYSATFIRPHVFWVTWKEADGTTVTHVEDFESGNVHASITQPDLTFLTLKGRWTKII